jgi:hypothetical protein
VLENKKNIIMEQVKIPHPIARMVLTQTKIILNSPNNQDKEWLKTFKEELNKLINPE